MVGVGVRRMVMVLPGPMAVMVLPMGYGGSIGLAGSGAFQFTQGAAFG